MSKIEYTALNAKLIPIDKIIANDYNPNRVAKPEMELLKKSIEDNGFCFPIVVIYDKEADVYVVVDGFHRYKVAKEYLNLNEVPVVVLKHDIKKRISATIQFNRARGTHQILDMSKIVADLYNKGMKDDEIMQSLGMEKDEVIRLKQISGLKEAFGEFEFSKSWEEVRYKLDQEIEDEEDDC